MNVINNDLLIAIFSYLPARDVWRCASVCREWWRFVDSYGDEHLPKLAVKITIGYCALDACYTMKQIANTPNGHRFSIVQFVPASIDDTRLPTYVRITSIVFRFRRVQLSRRLLTALIHLINSTHSRHSFAVDSIVFRRVNLSQMPSDFLFHTFLATFANTLTNVSFDCVGGCTPQTFTTELIIASLNFEKLNNFHIRIMDETDNKMGRSRVRCILQQRRIRLLTRSLRRTAAPLDYYEMLAYATFQFEIDGRILSCVLRSSSVEPFHLTLINSTINGRELAEFIKVIRICQIYIYRDLIKIDLYFFYSNLTNYCKLR